MIDIKLIRNNLDYVQKSLSKKGVDPKKIEAVFNLDKKYRELLNNLENKKAEQNKVSSEISSTENETLKKEKISGLTSLKAEIKSLEEKTDATKKELQTALSLLPNLPDEDALLGEGEEDNKVIKTYKDIPKFDFDVSDHIQIGKNLDLIDTEQAAKVSGARFFYLKNEAVLMELGLIQIALKLLISEGFVPIIPPVLIKPDVYAKMGRLVSDEKEDKYYIPKDDLYLVGSAEHTIGPFHLEYTFKESELPKRYIGFSTSFRREAGSHGKDTKGILRVHQFDKLEMFSFCLPENSKKEHQFLLSLQEKMMQMLDIPYQVVEVCTKDMGFTDARQYDIEAWIPSQKKYRETHSCSNTTDFQARGINAKFKDQKTKKKEYVHMLNATCFAMTRILIAILENNQKKDGSVVVPEVLREYVGKEIIMPKKDVKKE